jgi:small subunit ribosomal protein S6
MTTGGVPDVTRRYEVVYIFDTALEEAAVNERLARFHALLGGAQPTVNHWGKRALANSIKRKDTGYYVVEQFEAEPTVLPEFERAIKLEEGVLRFLTVQLEGEMPAAIPVETAAAVAAEEDEE